MLHGLVELRDAFTLNMDVSQREIKGQGQGTLPMSAFKDNPDARTEQYTNTQTKTLLYEVLAERSLIA